MGILQSKVKQRENHPLNKDIKNRAAKRETDFNCGEGTDLTGNLNDTSDITTQLISHQTETSNGSEATLTRMHQVPGADAPQSGEKTCTPKPELLQATPATPTAGLRRGVKTSAGGCDAQMSAGLQQLQDATEKLSQRKSRPPAQAQKQTKPVQHQKNTTAPVQQQATTQVMHGRAQHEESRTDTLSQHRPAAKEAREVPPHTVRTITPSDVGVRTSADSVHKSEVSASVQVLETPEAECSFGNKEQGEMVSLLPASEMQVPVRQANREVVRGVTTGNLHSKKAKSGQKSNRLLSNANKAGTNLTRHATDKPKTTGIAEGPSDHSTQNRSTQVNNKENAQHKRSLNRDSVTNMTAAAVEGNPIKKQNEPHQTPQPNKGDRDADGSTSSCVQKVKVKAAAPAVTVVEGMPADAPDNTAIRNLKSSAVDTSDSLRLQRELQVSVPQDTAVKPKKKCLFKALNQSQHKKNTRKAPTEEEMSEKSAQAEKEKPDTGVTSAVPFKRRVLAEGRWHPFTVNQSCSRKARCKHNLDTGLPPNVQKWFDEPPNYLREPPRVTTARLAAFSALREVEEEGIDYHQ